MQYYENRRLFLQPVCTAIGRKGNIQMIRNAVIGILVPFIGTAAGAASVFFTKHEPGRGVQRALLGFAGGVMVAASVWSLIIPAIERSEQMGRLSFFPAVAGFWGGILFLMMLDRIIPRLKNDALRNDKSSGKLSQTAMLVLAVTLHNIPEGMAVGAVYAGYLSCSADITAGAAFALAMGIAIQNFPEGAIISMPLRAENKSMGRAFSEGVLSGVVEPIAAVITIFLAGVIIPAMPYFLSFAAGAMVYVVVKELIPEMNDDERADMGVIMFAAGFTIMMALDVALG